MLNRKIQIVTNLGLFFDYLNQIVINFLRITVENPDPSDSTNLTEITKQLIKTLLSIKILSVQCRLLCHQDQFFHSLFRKVFCLFDQALHRNTPVIATDFWYNTVSTMLIASFCNLQICKMSSGGNQTFRLRERKCIDICQLHVTISRQCFFHRIHDLVIRCRSKNSINFRNLFLNLFLISLGKASCHNQRL